MQSEYKRIAIIDLGSNSACLSIMEYTEDDYSLILQIKRKVKLAEGMNISNQISDKALSRAIEVIADYKMQIEAKECHKIIFVATEAMRRAENTHFVQQTIFNITGLKPNVISAAQEAYYAYKGVINTTDKQDFLLIDTGGASTEIILVRDSKIAELKSIAFGSLLLSERFCSEGNITIGQFFRMTELIEEQLSRIDWIEKAENIPIIGIGGSNRTIARIYKMQIKDFAPARNVIVPSRSLNTIYCELLESDVKKRKKILGEGSASREDTIIAGCAPIVFLRRYLMSDEIMISQSGLREGVFFAAIGK